VLSTLRATPQYVIHLLRPRNSLPSLTHVEVDPDFPMFDPGAGELSMADRFVGVEESLTRLARRRDITSLGLHLPLDRSAEAWLMTGSHPRRGKRSNVERSLVHINSLTLCATLSYQVSDRTISLIPKWLSLFPTLQHTDFSVLSGRMSSVEEKKFLRAVVDTCPKMETVQVISRQSGLELRRETGSD